MGENERRINSEGGGNSSLAEQALKQVCNLCVSGSLEQQQQQLSSSIV
jgi:hypothetical protein